MRPQADRAQTRATKIQASKKSMSFHRKHGEAKAAEAVQTHPKTPLLSVIVSGLGRKERRYLA